MNMLDIVSSFPFTILIIRFLFDWFSVDNVYTLMLRESVHYNRFYASEGGA